VSVGRRDGRFPRASGFRSSGRIEKNGAPLLPGHFDDGYEALIVKFAVRGMNAVENYSARGFTKFGRLVFNHQFSTCPMRFQWLD